MAKRRAPKGTREEGEKLSRNGVGEPNSVSAEGLFSEIKPNAVGFARDKGGQGMPQR